VRMLPPPAPIDDGRLAELTRQISRGVRRTRPEIREAIARENRAIVRTALAPRQRTPNWSDARQRGCSEDEGDYERLMVRKAMAAAARRLP
jgi:hypothetical protein